MGFRFRFREKWLLLFLLVALVPLFQNMSPFENSVIDIRDIAPRKPAGNWNSDYAQYFPSTGQQDITSVSDAQNQLLGHNFNGYLKGLEQRYLTIDNHTFSGGPQGTSVGTLDSKSSRWSLGMINSNKLRLMYLNDKIFNGLQFSMETGSASEGVNFHISQDLGKNWGLGVSHQTELRQSRVQLDYRW